MNKNKEWKILQIIAAQVGWKSIYCQESENGQIKIFNRAIICWALVEAVGESRAARTQVRGIEQQSNRFVVVEDIIGEDKTGEGGIDPNQYFLGYDDPEAHKESDYWIKQANVRLKTESDKRAKPRDCASRSIVDAHKAKASESQENEA